MAIDSKHVLRTVAKHGKCVGRPKNAEVRVHEHLTPGEVEQLAQAAKERWWHGHRDALAIRMVARHAFRVSELCELRRHQIDLRAGLVHVTRKKNGVPSTHPLDGDEVRPLRQLRRDWPDGRQVFVTERGAPFTRSGFAEMVARAGEAAGFASPSTSTCFATPAGITTRTVARIPG